MSFVRLEPEVPGEWGSRTRVDASIHPPRVDRLHLDVTNWLGDDLVESFPCFAVTPRLAEALERSDLTGFSISDMVTTVSPTQTELAPWRRVPQFRRLAVTGAAGCDDAGVDSRHHLVASDRLLRLLRRFELRSCDVEPWRG